MGENCQPI